MHFDEAPAEGESQACALVAARIGAVDLLELAKELGQVLFLHPDPGVMHRNRQLVG